MRETSRQSSESNPERQPHGDEVDLVPERLVFPVPVFIAPGFAETPRTMKASLDVFMKSGRRVLSLGHPHRIDIGPVPESASAYPKEEVQKALHLLRFLEKKGIDRIDAVAHSGGGINIAIAATFHPELFRNILFVDPAGLIGKDTLQDLARRFLKERKDSSKEAIRSTRGRKQLSTAVREATKYIAQNPRQALNEVIAITETEIAGILHNLHERGIGIAVMHGVDDDVFPMERVQQHTHGDDIDGFYAVRGGHDELVMHPEKYAQAAERILEALEKKQKT